MSKQPESEPLGEAYCADVEFNIEIKPNRWRFILALLTPRVKTIRLVQSSAAIFIHPRIDQ